MSSITNNQKAYHRDKLIFEGIEKHGVLDTDQVRCLYFRGLKSSKLITQRRLKRLFDTKKIKRGRSLYNSPYYYYVDKKHGQVDYLLGINWIYIWLKMNLKWWQELFTYEYEVDYGILRADALAGLYNTVRKTHQFYFIEFDRAESGNSFDKVQKYNSLYSSKRYLSSWWVKHSTRFPKIIIVTTSEKRKLVIEKKIEGENTENLEFEVYLLEEIKGACLNACDNRFNSE